MDPIAADLPLVDLHRHLDGNVRLETVLAIGREHGVKLPADSVEGLRPYGQVQGTAPSLMEFIANPGAAATGLLRGRKDTRVPMMVTLLGYWVVAAPLGLWLSEVLEAGITGFWLGLLAGTFVTSALLVVRALRQRGA